MYRIGKNYKIELKDKIFYTGKIIEEDSLQIQIITVRDEEIVINKSEIRQSRLIQKSIGENSGTAKRR